MEINEELYQFILTHNSSDITALRLKKNKNNSFDISFAIDQIESRKKIKNKLPLWYNNHTLLFPSVISSEQSSSEYTARYKADIIAGKSHSQFLICDLTGGLGIDSYYFSLKAKKVLYIERFPDYCKIAKHNFNVLNAENIDILNTDSDSFCHRNEEKFDFCYIDPARRSINNKRVFAFESCEPNVLSMIPEILKFSDKMMIKASPMIDINLAISQLKDVSEVYIVSVQNECKEILFYIDKYNSNDVIPIYCTNIFSDYTKNVYCFNLKAERSLPSSTYAECMQRYLYEPNSSVLKGGAFKSIAETYGLNKLDASSHLYTEDRWIKDFPGKIFEVLDVIVFSGKILKTLSHKYDRLLISTRNFPLSPEEIRKRSNIKDGGELYLFATTLFPQKKILIIAKRIIV